MHARRLRRHAERVPGGSLVLVVMAVIAVGLYWNSRGDAGSSQPLAVLDTGDFHALAFGSGASGGVFFGHHNGVMRSDDDGSPWRTGVERATCDAMGLAVDPRDPRPMYLGGHDILQRSTDGGASWQALPHNLPGTDIHGFAIHPDDGSRLYAHVVGQGGFRSADGGRTWQRLPGQLPSDVMTLAVGAKGEVLYAGSMRSGLLVSADEGRSWTRTSSPFGMVFALAADPVSPGTIYVGSDDGLYRSTDRGGTWGKLPFPGENVVTVAVDPARPEVLLAFTVKEQKGHVYRSEDGGQTWGGAS